MVRSPARAARRAARGVLRTLISQRGEASGGARAARSGSTRALDEPGGRISSAPRARLLARPRGRARAPPPTTRLLAAQLAALERVTEPPRQEVFRRMNMAPGGTAALSSCARACGRVEDQPQLAVIDTTSRTCSAPGSTAVPQARRIDWSTPAGSSRS
jgi:malonyl-CoA decarboxylase